MFTLTLNKSNCIFCKACIENCPTGKWEKDDDEKVRLNENRCVYCYSCVSLCPVNAIKSDILYEIPIKEQKLSETELFDFFKTRRTIRAFTDQKVDEDIIKKILSNVKYLPSKGNKHKLKFTVLQDEAVEKLVIGVKSFFSRLMLLTEKKINRKILHLFSKPNDRYLYTEEFRHIITEVIASETDRISYNAKSIILIHGKDEYLQSEEAWINGLQISYNAGALKLAGSLNMLIPLGINKNYKLKSAMGLDMKDRVFAAVLIGYPRHKYYLDVYRDDIDVNWF